MNNPLARSLSLRLLAIFFVTGLLALLILGLLFSYGLGYQWQRSIEPHLDRYIGYVQRELGDPPSPDKAREIATNLPVNIYIYEQGRLSYSTSGLPLAVDTLRPARGRYRPDRDERRRRADRAPPPMPPRFAENPANHSRVLYWETPTHTVYYEFRRRATTDRNLPLLIGLALLSALMLGSYLMIRRQLKPLGQIESSVGRIAAGDLQHRVTVRGKDELAELGSRVNIMAERIQAMLDAKRQLLIALSHELRSPLARARIATELLPESVNRERIADDLNELDTMIGEIMESERLQTHAVLNRSDVDLNALLQSIADTHESAVHLQLPDERIAIQADEARLRILVRNLVNNALLHGQPAADSALPPAWQGKPVAISLQREPAASPPPGDTATAGQWVRIRVQDAGPGIAADQREQVTEAFYRGDASRTRSTGGSGMGLTLARLIAEAHEGRLVIEDTHGAASGTTVSVWLPAS